MANKTFSTMIDSVRIHALQKKGEVADINEGIQMCSNLKPQKEPYD